MLYSTKKNEHISVPVNAEISKPKPEVTSIPETRVCLFAHAQEAIRLSILQACSSVITFTSITFSKHLKYNHAIIIIIYNNNIIIIVITVTEASG